MTSAVHLHHFRFWNKKYEALDFVSWSVVSTSAGYGNRTVRSSIHGRKSVISTGYGNRPVISSINGRKSVIRTGYGNMILRQALVIGTDW
jgi:hypothetical protein